MSKGLRINHLSKCIIIRRYKELWFKGYVLLLELLERVMVSKCLRVIPFGLCRLSNGDIKMLRLKG